MQNSNPSRQKRPRTRNNDFSAYYRLALFVCAEVFYSDLSFLRSRMTDTTTQDLGIVHYIYLPANNSLLDG